MDEPFKSHTNKPGNRRDSMYAFEGFYLEGTAGWFHRAAWEPREDVRGRGAPNCAFHAQRGTRKRNKL